MGQYLAVDFFMFLLSFVLFDLIGIGIDGWITVSHISFCIPRPVYMQQRDTVYSEKVIWREDDPRQTPAPDLNGVLSAVSRGVVYQLV